MQRIAEIQRALKQEGLDGWLFFDHHKRDPLAYRVLDFDVKNAPTRRWYYLVPAEGEPRKLVHKIEAGMLDALPGSKHSYAGWAQQADALRTLLAGCRRVAMQYSPRCAVPYVAMVDAGTVELIRSLGVEVATSADLVQFFEARWNAAKLESHLEAGRRVDEILRAAFAKVGSEHQAGRHPSEIEIQHFIRTAFTDNGLFADHGPIVGVNAHAADPHFDPAPDISRPIQPGDWLLIDLWAKLTAPGAVYYDITWTGYCGPEVPSQHQRIFDIVTGARDLAIQCVQQAISQNRTLHGFEVDDAARGHIAAAGYGDFFFHRTGHSIGEEVHGTGANMDNLETHDERRVIPWTCFSIEPGIYLDTFGVRSEVNMFIGEDGARVTGAVQTRPVLIGA
ncbi:MAG: M24 family metallopeptidase [Bryobacteraceae bacterium]|nr:M24 family metallopeptidase [Bryobacteraceae bacterium]